MAEGSEDDSVDDHSPSSERLPHDNSVGRVLSLSDGIFAIAMTLLALDLRVPDAGKHPSDATLRHALSTNSASYLAFGLSFYVIANYWVRHRKLMKSVVTVHPVLIRDTLILLAAIAAMPFPTSLLGHYASDPISLVFYGALNVVAMGSMILLSYDIKRLNLNAEGAESEDYSRNLLSWLNLGVFVLCIPAGYVLGSKGPYELLLLAVPERLIWIQRQVAQRLTRRRSSAAGKIGA